MPYHQPFQITGFHSCDREIGLAILNGEMSLNPSNNDYDWLGPGIYFWEQNPQRALQYAIQCAKGKQHYNGSIRIPFVLGALIEVGYCLNLLEPDSGEILKKAHSSLQKVMRHAGKKMPENIKANRALDCAVIQYVHHSNSIESLPPYDSVRSAFVEGSPVYPQSTFTDRLHIEICIINTDCIQGYFLPQPIEKFNPYLKKDFIG